jgi:hypothetical protein
MRSAFCTLNNETYQVEGFEDETNFAVIRSHLVCTECRMEAFYRRQGTDGRIAHFVSRHHVADCTQATIGGTIAATVTAPTGINQTDRRIIIDFNLRAPATTPATQGVTPQNQNTTRTRQTRQTVTTAQADIRMQLSQVLNTLITDPLFQRSTQMVDVPDRGEYIFTDLFMEFSDVTAHHENRFHGYWGRITSVRLSGGTYYFNTGTPQSVSICLDERYFAEVARQYNVQNCDQLAGSDLLVFGELRVSGTTNRKLHIGITDPSKFAMILA